MDTNPAYGTATSIKIDINPAYATATTTYFMCIASYIATYVHTHLYINYVL